MTDVKSRHKNETGTLLSRQRALPSRRLFLFRGMAGTAALAYATRSAAAIADAHAPYCGLTPEQTVGPYYLDLERVRQDITEGKTGLPLKLRVTVVDGKRCGPIENAALDIWHCDALGRYSGFTANSPDGPPGRPPRGFGPPPGPPPGFDASRPGPPPGFGNRKHDATTFLRGVQLTNADGVVEFSTIYPGWYAGRDMHIHLRVHVGGQIRDTKYGGGHIAYTGQLFFPEDVSDAVAKQQPYATHHSSRTRQDEDDVFATQHGRGSIVTLAQLKKGSIEEGFVATAVLGVDPNAISKDIGPGGPPGSGRGRHAGWPGAPNT
jgi:protocatechuate 3,4-dioxygenase beta subunit